MIAIKALQEQRRGKICKALSHPFVAIRIGADGVAPPLVGHFMWADYLEISVKIVEAQVMAGRGVQERSQRQIDQPRPRLAIARCVLLCHRKMLIRSSPKIVGVELDR